MGVVGSLPLNEIIDIQNGLSLSSSDQTINKTIPDYNKTCNDISLDPVCVKKDHLNGSSRRGLKHRVCHNKIMKHKLRCKKTRILNSTHDNIQEELKKQIHKLEFKQNNLLSQVEKLYLYRQQLEVICQQVHNANNQLIEKII